MNFLLLDKNEKYINNLRVDITAERQREINTAGALLDTLSLVTTDTVEKGQRILYQDEMALWHEFIVREVRGYRAGGVQEQTVYCEASFYEMTGDYIEDKRPTDTSATAALMTALEPTRWQVGQVDNLGTNSTSFYQISCKEAMEKVAEVWGGEIRPRIVVTDNEITARYIDLKKAVGNALGKRFTYEKDISYITKTVGRADVITALYGYGKGEEVGDGYGRRIRFGEINGGKDYVENLNALAIWGRLQPDGSRAHVYGKEVFDEVEDTAELLALTTAKLEELSVPEINYTADVIDLKALGYEHEGVDIGDTVIVIDKEFVPELRLNARVLGLTENLIDNTKVITIGNFLPLITDELSRQTGIIDSFRSRTGVWDRANSFDGDGYLNTQYLQGVMDVTRNKLMATQSGWYTDDNGNLVFDALDGSSSMMLTGGGFLIANEKLPNGEWKYRTFGTGDGFIADYIIAGALVGGNVAWNLSDGTLLIGESTTNYQLYFDGTTLKVKAANIDGKLTASQMNVSSLSAISANLGNIIAGALVGGNVAWNLSDGTLLIGESTTNYQLYFDGTTLKVKAANIDGKLTASQMNVSSLSAISANLGTVTAGTLTSNSTINVNTNLTVGEKIILSPVSGLNTGIYFRGVGGIIEYNGELTIVGADIILQPGGNLVWQSDDPQFPNSKILVDYNGVRYADYLGNYGASAYYRGAIQYGVAEISTTAGTTVSQTITFPEAFASAPTVQLTMGGTAPQRFQISVQYITTTQCTIYVRDTTTSTAYVRWLAVL